MIKTYKLFLFNGKKIRRRSYFKILKLKKNKKIKYYKIFK